MLSKNAERVFIVTYQLPLRIEAGTEKINLYSRKSDLVSAVKSFATQVPDHSKALCNEVFWAGMPGCSTGTWSQARTAIPSFTFRLCPVFIRPEVDQALPELFFFEELTQDAYLHINREFSGSLERYIRPNDTLWIPDHRLLALAARMRERIPEINIGSFISFPFPVYETMKRLPAGQRDEVLRGILGADLVVFQREEDRGNFLQCVQMLLGMENDDNVIRNEARLVSTSVIPLAGNEELDQEWLRKGLSALRISKEVQARFQVRFFDLHSRNGLLDRYRSAQKRLFLLDYDGTLTPFFNLPALARPDNLLLDILTNIGSNPRNSVYIVSGRDSRTLDSWLGHLPVNIIAEHGAKVRYYQGQWEEKAVPAAKWRAEVEQLMQRYSDRCPHSFIEYKDFSIVWHYRNSPLEQVMEVKLELYAGLCGIAEALELQVMMGNKIIEVRNGETNKGAAIRHVLAREAVNFILAVGDDRTDEDMFRMLTKVDNAFTIKVGAEASFAQFNMHTPQMVISLLGNMVFLDGKGTK